MKNTCDMHIHTNKSDGTLSGLEVLKLARARNLAKLSITDHDCIDFYFDDEAQSYLQENDFEIVTGCEFICMCNNVPIEILGYGFNLKQMKKYLDIYGITQNKIDFFRSRKIPQMFQKMGVKLDFDKSKIDFNSNHPKVLNYIFETISKNEMLMNLLNQENPNLTTNQSHFLREGLNNPNSKFYIDMSEIYPNFKNIVDIIHKTGGLAFLAHPYQYNVNMFDVLENVKPFIDGIECYHYSCYASEKLQTLLNFCDANNKMISGGSDFHYLKQNTEKNKLNELNIPAIYFDKIKDIVD